MIPLPNDECTFRTTEDEVHATVIPEIGLIVKFYRPIDGDYWYGKCPLTGDNDAIPTGQNVRLERKYQQSLMAEQGARIAELEGELKTSNEWQQHYRDETETLADEIETLNDDIDELRG